MPAMPRCAAPNATKVATVEIAHADDVEPRQIGLEAELARILVVEFGLDLDAGTPQQWHDRFQDPPLGERQNQSLVAAHGISFGSAEPRI
ncbi:MAG: hypothetical protein WDN69_04490 [Aliidongia sp.]